MRGEAATQWDADMADRMLQFVRLDQRQPERRAPTERRRDFAEIYHDFAPPEAAAQSSRRSQCGVPLCSLHCPLGNNIPGWLKLTAEGPLATNNFPEICGRICPQDRLCEASRSSGSPRPRGFSAMCAVSGMRAIHMHLGLPDRGGRQTVTPVAGSHCTVLAVTALGFDAEDLPRIFNEPELELTPDHPVELAGVVGRGVQARSLYNPPPYREAGYCSANSRIIPVLALCTLNNLQGHVSGRASDRLLSRSA